MQARFFLFRTAVPVFEKGAPGGVLQQGGFFLGIAVAYVGNAQKVVNRYQMCIRDRYGTRDIPRYVAVQEWYADDCLLYTSRCV